MIKLVLLRHGESTWNKENRFAGWTDVPLTEKGAEEAKKAGHILKRNGFKFDIVFTSVLKRAIATTDIVLKKMDLKHIQVEKSWCLNERHYGTLQGLDKAEMASKYGEKQVFKWRRSYNIRPPALKKTDKRWPGNDFLYADVDKNLLPLTESLKDTVARVLPYWKKEIVPLLRKEKSILISTHGNSLRALVKNIDNIPDTKIVSFNIPTGVPLVYELGNNLKPIRHYFLGNPKEIQNSIKAVVEQGKAKK